MRIRSIHLWHSRARPSRRLTVGTSSGSFDLLPNSILNFVPELVLGWMGWTGGVAGLFLKVPLVQFVVLVFEARTIAQEKGCSYEPPRGYLVSGGKSKSISPGHCFRALSRHIFLHCQYNY